jgi:hypothetical protein
LGNLAKFTAMRRASPSDHQVSTAGLFLVVAIGEREAVFVQHEEASAVVFNRPGWWEAAEWSSQIMSLGIATAPANPGRLPGDRAHASLR